MRTVQSALPALLPVPVVLDPELRELLPSQGEALTTGYLPALYPVELLPAVGHVDARVGLQLTTFAVATVRYLQLSESLLFSPSAPGERSRIDTGVAMSKLCRLAQRALVRSGLPSAAFGAALQRLRYAYQTYIDAIENTPTTLTPGQLSEIIHAKHCVGDCVIDLGLKTGQETVRTYHRHLCVAAEIYHHYLAIGQEENFSPFEIPLKGGKDSDAPADKDPSPAADHLRVALGAIRALTQHELSHYSSRLSTYASQLETALESALTPPP